jgi:hypothetical protein
MRISSDADGALSVGFPIPPANALTTAAIIITTTSISITPTTGETALSRVFVREFITIPLNNEKMQTQFSYIYDLS